MMRVGYEVAKEEEVANCLMCSWSMTTPGYEDVNQHLLQNMTHEVSIRHERQVIWYLVPNTLTESDQ